MEMSKKKSSDKVKKAHRLTTINSGNLPKTCHGFDIIDRSDALYNFEVHRGDRGKGGGGGGTDDDDDVIDDDDDDDDGAAQIVSLVDNVRTKVSINIHYPSYFFI